MVYNNYVDNYEVMNNVDKKYDDTYIEIIPDNAIKYVNLINNNDILLNNKEIEEYNKRIKERNNSFYNLDNYINISKEDIYNIINNYNIPSLPKYNGNIIYTKDNIIDILNNRNLNNIDNNIKKGLVIRRTNLRSLPTSINFYSNKNIKDFDRLQETEVYVNTPIVILQESLDKVYSFVITPTYAGWVLSNDIAYINEEELDYFINNDSFLVITDSKIKMENNSLDMGVKLPYIGVNEDGYIASIPIKNNNNYVIKKNIVIEKSKAHIGYLPYTKRNIIIEAFKYENTPYSWGGYNEGIDCSSYIANIFKTFGFVFPRNTSDQRNSIGEVTSLEGMSKKNKLDIIDDEYLSILYRIGHVMLYLGKINNINYIIHANAKDMEVSVTPLDNDNLEAIDRRVLVK